MKEISIVEKDIQLRKILSQKADDIEVLYDFLNNNQVTESEFQIELENFSKLIKEFELKLILNGENDSKDAILSSTSAELAVKTTNPISPIFADSHGKDLFEKSRSVRRLISVLDFGPAITSTPMRFVTFSYLTLPSFGRFFLI